MKRYSFKSILQVFIVLLFCFPFRITGEHDEDTWMEPDAWARDHLSFNDLQSEVGKCCKCSEESYQTKNPTQQPNQHQQQKATEDTVSLMYFKKFITLLFNRKKLKYDSTLEIYERSLFFTLSSSQLDKLHRLQDPRDLDNILTEIFDNVRIPNMYRDGHILHTTEASGFKTLVFDIFHDMWQLIKTSEVRFLLIATLVIILGWYLNHCYHIGWLPLIAGGMFLYGYLHTYLECNREIEVNEMLEMLKRNKGAQQGIQKDSRFMSFLKNIFSNAGNSQDLEQQQQLKKSAKISLGFCRPDHVIIMYFNDIFLKYLQVLLEQCTATLTKLKDGLPFPFNYFAGIMLICIVGYILKLTFKYILSPAAWAHLMHINHSYPSKSHSAVLTNTDTKSHNEDRISGENLKMLLNVMNSVPQLIQTPAVSGVEELMEAIEAAPINTSTSSDTSPNKILKNNNNLNDKVLDDKTKVTLEDCSEEDCS